MGHKLKMLFRLFFFNIYHKIRKSQQFIYFIFFLDAFQKKEGD